MRQFQMVPTRRECEIMQAYPPEIAAAYYRYGTMAITTFLTDDWRGNLVRRALPRRVLDRYQHFTGRIHQLQEKNGLRPIFYACSGQGIGKKKWAVARVDKPGWRLSGDAGRVRLFESKEAADEAAREMNVAGGHRIA